MTDYREATQTGEIKTWRRAYKIICENPYQGMPSISFHEEEKIILPDGTILPGPCHDPKNVTQALTDPSETITLINPETGEVIGETTYGALYTVLYSMYIHLASERDANQN